MDTPPTEGILQTTDYMNFTVMTPAGQPICEFIGAKTAGKALPGDLVRWNSVKQTCELLSRVKHWPLVGIIELTSKSKYGMTSRGVPMYLFTPSRKGYPMMVVGCSERDCSKNRLALVEFDVWNETGFPRGNLRKLLGVCGEQTAEKETILLTYNPFPTLKTIPEPAPISWEGRVDTPQQTFNIDPEGCRDIDDVISIEPPGQDGLGTIWITIADVAEVIPHNSVLDKTAQLQGLTAYENGQAVKPMLPHSYSEGHCSLLPGSVRPGVSLILTIRPHTSQNYTIISKSWCLSRVHNSKQYSYDSFIREGTYDGINIPFLAGVASELLGHATYDPHEWIEAFMLIYNKESAKLLRKTGTGILRKHSMPDLAQLAKYTALGGKDLAVLANKSATYCAADDPEPLHYGLSSNVYCHCSSPIRRYADLFNQRILKQIISNQSVFHEMANLSWLNQRQSDIKRFERDCFILDKLSLNKKDEITALILEIMPYECQGYPMKKIKLWIPSWKRLHTWKTSSDVSDSIGAGVEIRLTYFANPSVRFWKQKIIFRLEGIVGAEV